MNIEQTISAIISVVPESEAEMKKAESDKNAYTIIKIFTAHIKYFIEDKSNKRYRKSLSLMNTIYQKGDSPLQRAVEQIFIYSLDLLLFCCGPRQRKSFISWIPIDLYTVYISQISRSCL